MRTHTDTADMETDTAEQLRRLRHGVGRLVVDLARGLGDLVERFTSTGSFRREDSGASGIALVVSRTQDRLVGQIVGPRRPPSNDRPAAPVAPCGEAPALGQPHADAWLCQLLAELRSESGTSVPMLVLIDPAAAPEAFGGHARRQRLDRRLRQLAEGTAAVIAVVDYRPGYRPGGKNQPAFMPLWGEPVAEDFE